MIGTAAFWGKRNIEQVQTAALPVERSRVSLESPHGHKPTVAEVSATRVQAEAGVTADELNQCAHRLLKVAPDGFRGFERHLEERGARGHLPTTL